ncbi:MAG: hypothetical protein LAQ30_04880 [Acidobacteriia bacterium]|nr:hypothetical protein [Terriglobia bacterium]
MPVQPGEKQERVLFKYLRFQMCCVDVIQGDQKVRELLGMKGMYKCADALGLHTDINGPGPRRITVAESKGTDMGSAVEQLGNAAAGVFEKFGRETRVDLLVLVPTLVERPSGFLSPGAGYRADPLKTGLNKFTLLESPGGAPFPARPKVTYPEWVTWAPRVNAMPIIILRLDIPAS